MARLSRALRDGEGLGGVAPAVIIAVSLATALFSPVTPIFRGDLAAPPDVLVVYLPRFDEYVIRTGDAPLGVIRFCPRLPESKRDRWFEELDGFGFDNPFEQEIPDAYCSAAWHRLPKDYMKTGGSGTDL